MPKSKKMSFVEKYLFDIGIQTGNAMKMIIYKMISEQYKNKYGDERCST